jgi:hypothetical protein
MDLKRVPPPEDGLKEQAIMEALLGFDLDFWDYVTFAAIAVVVARAYPGGHVARSGSDPSGLRCLGEQVQSSEPGH